MGSQSSSELTRTASCTWCPGSSGLDSDFPNDSPMSKNGANKITALNMYDENTASSANEEYLKKSTDSKYTSTRSRKRTRGASFDMFVSIPEEFKAENLVIRRSRVPSTKMSRVSQHSGASSESTNLPP